MKKLLEEEWIQIATDFGKRRNFANCFKAIDEKHVKQPSHCSGSMFYNYNSNCIDFMAVINTNL